LPMWYQCSVWKNPMQAMWYSTPTLLSQCNVMWCLHMHCISYIVDLKYSSLKEGCSNCKNKICCEDENVNQVCNIYLLGIFKPNQQAFLNSGW
jgi:hypothetical protein